MADGGYKYGREQREKRAACENWARYEYAKQRGHFDYCIQAIRNERFYLGGGLQWSDDDREELEATGRRAIEFNEIADAINTALGNHIQNRMDIGFRPRSGDADADKATTLSKVAMQVADNNDFRHKETEICGDGFIQQRGYWDMRVDYNDNLTGEIRMDVLDPLDVIPDPDGKSYDPDDWKDVIITRWMSVDQIEQLYGRKKRKQVLETIEPEGDDDFGEDEFDGVRRAKFGMLDAIGADWVPDKDTDGWESTAMVRVIDRQHWKLVSTLVALYPSGDIRIIEDASESKIQAALNAGAMTFRRPMKRVRWTVSTYGEVLLHDGWSPFEHFTVVPFFPFFRRGQTRGLIDNAIGPQEMLNKSLSQFLHIINTTANSGWLIEENSLTNMSTDDLDENGASTGLVLEYAKGSTRPEKIEPNQVPTGIDRLVQLGSQKIRTVTGISDAMRGQAPAGQSGRAIQSLQFGSQLSLAVPLDNLARTRHMVAKRMLKMIQGFMDMPQVLRIAKRGADGSETTEELPINMEMEDGSVLNDLTIGEYDVVVTEQPSQVTFENSQYEQAMAMRKEGIMIPEHVVLRYSNLADKTEIIREMREAQANQQANVLEQAKAALAEAQAAKAQADSVKAKLEAIFSAMRASQLLRSDPALAGLSDDMLLSSGFVDSDPAPIVPAATALGLPPGAPPPVNTNPLTPDNPGRGVTAGIENGSAVTA